MALSFCPAKDELWKLLTSRWLPGRAASRSPAGKVRKSELCARYGATATAENSVAPVQAPPNSGRRIGLSTASGMCAWTIPPFIDHCVSWSYWIGVSCATG